MIALVAQIPFLKDIIILLGFSVGIVYVLQRLKLPSILGFIVTGILIGPNGLALVSAQEEVEVLAEIGIILLLFVIGLELSIKQLLSIRKTVFLGGTIQVLLTLVLTAVIFYIVGFTIEQSIFIGFLGALSSTAIVLRLIQDNNELSTSYGRNALGILIFQDIIVVPMMLIIPLLAGKNDNIMGSLGSMLLKTVLMFLFTWIMAKYIVPKFFHRIALTKNKELFLLTTITLCFAIAYITAQTGLSLALGALLAGLIISESEYNHQATSLILPFKELFLSLFFISIGMLLNVSFFIQNFWVIVGITALIILAKTGIVMFTVRILQNDFKTILLTGFALAQVGEFAFVLSRVGITHGLISETTNQYFLSVSILSMIATPFILLLVRDKTKKSTQKIDAYDADTEPISEELNNHLIIVGYGINGKNVARAARYAQIPYVIVELNPDLVNEARKAGEPIYFGDATDIHLLELLHIENARVVVIGIADPVNTRHILQSVRSITQSVFVIVRTRLVNETEDLIAMGADEVIPEEFETSIEIFSKTLNNFLIPKGEVEYLVKSFRQGNYQLFSEKYPRDYIRPTQIPDIKVSCLKVLSDSGKIVGNTLKEAAVRKNYSITILAITRKGTTKHLLEETETIQPDDLLYISGDEARIDHFRTLIQ